MNHNSIAFIVHGDRHIIWTQGNVFTDEDKFEQSGIIGNWFKEHNKTVYDVFSMLEGRVEDLELNTVFTYNQ